MPVPNRSSRRQEPVYMIVRDLSSPTMTEYDLNRVEKLFQEAADLPAEERKKFLDRECDGEASLRDHVERLLARLERDASFLSPVSDRGPFLAAAIAEGPGAVIGRYKLLQVIGEGGFGVVYMAEQQEPVVRKVALKIIKLGMDTKEVVARFEAERQALALMDHPNIAQVHDGGATDSGRPYFVMELVRGVSITEYCDKNSLPTVERLDLFASVCQAVQHAHQKGVIHRDIKPSNVLVTLHDGLPLIKIIDFGVAKAMHTRLTEKTLFTRYEQFIGTPAYMSPEQAEMSALDVDTRTDIYSLGVLLYELLTGATPFHAAQIDGVGLLEIQRRIREESPLRPSLRISTTADATIAQTHGLDSASLSRRLRGDVDWIVMKALEKERSRRYATASEFAEDIRRHMKKEPVLAGPPGAAYRLRKFLDRNRTPVFSAILIAIALIIGMIGTWLGKVQADHNANLAREEAQLTTVALDFLLSTLALSNPNIALNPEVTMVTVLDHTAEKASEVFAGQAWAEARIRGTIGRAYTALSESEKAEIQLNLALELAEKINQNGRANILGRPTFSSFELYQVLWALTNVSFNLDRSNAFEISKRAHNAGMACIAEQHPELAELLGNFVKFVEGGAWSVAPDALDGVEEIFAESVSRSRSTLAHKDPLWAIVADTFLAGGYLVWYTPHEHHSEDFFGMALQIQRKELPPDHPDIAASVVLLVGILNNLGKEKQAEDLIRDTITALRRVHREGAFPIAKAESVLGATLVKQGRFAEAEPILQSSHKAILAMTESTSSWMAVESLMRMVSLYGEWGKPEEGRLYRDSLAQSSAYGNFIMQWKVARNIFSTSEQVLINILDQVNTLCGGIAFPASRGTIEAPELTPLLEQLFAERSRLLADEDPRSIAIARLLIGWANALKPEGQYELRARMAKEAQKILGLNRKAHSVDLAEAISFIADMKRAEGKTSEARKIIREAFRILQAGDPSPNWFMGAAIVRIGRSLLELQLYSESEELLLRGEKILEAQLGMTHNDAAVARELLVRLYAEWGKPDLAEPFKQTTE